jgi:hypothetical protein
MGEKLGVLDMLASSTTFANAILAQITLRSVSTVGCVLAAVWALSPLGGQASLRIMTVGQRAITNPAEFDYLSAENSYADWRSSSGAGSYAVTATGLYLASLTGPQRVKDSPADLWDNVKIPMLEDPPSWTEDSNPVDAWHQVPAHNVSYAALVGIPVSGLVSDDNAAEFSLETSYWSLDCPIVQRGDVCGVLNADSPGTNEPSPSFEPYGKKMFASVNHTSCYRTDWGGYEKAFSSSLFTNSSAAGADERGCAANQTDTFPRHIIYSGFPKYAASEGVDDEMFSALCTLSTSWVEVEVRCQGRECTVPRMRRSQLSHTSPGRTPLDDFLCTNFEYFSIWFLGVVDASSGSEGSLPQGYLAYPTDPSLAIHSAVQVPNPADIGSTLFAQRLGQLLNTWWLVSVGREIISSGVDMGKVGRVGEDLFSKYQAPLQLNTASGTLTRQVVIIKCSMGWFVALVAVSAVLITASVVPLVLRLWTRTPAFNLLPSTMLKDNPYFGDSKTGSTLESSERSRLLRRRMVRFGDVTPDEAVGYLAIGSLGDGSDGVGEVSRVQKGRLYR